MDARGRPDTVFYDGTCGLCHGFVRFLLARDPDGSRFRFAPLGGKTYLATVPPERRFMLPDSVVLVTADGEISVRAAAVERALGRTSGLWRRLGSVMALVPPRAADLGYDAVAATRRRIFGRPGAACPSVPAELRARFLD